MANIGDRNVFGSELLVKISIEQDVANNNNHKKLGNKQQQFFCGYCIKSIYCNHATASQYLNSSVN